MTKKDLERANAAAATLLVTAIGCSRGGAPLDGAEKPAPSHDSATTATAPTASEATSAASSAPKPEASAPPDSTAASSAPSPGHGPKFIGNATMRPDGTIGLDLRAAGSSGQAQMIYPPSHAEYQEILRHLGGLRPGQQKLVPAFPDNINDALVEQIAHAYIAEKKGWKREAWRSTGAASSTRSGTAKARWSATSGQRPSSKRCRDTSSELRLQPNPCRCQRRPWRCTASHCAPPWRLYAVEAP
jgi:hypothetical protein